MANPGTSTFPGTIDDFTAPGTGTYEDTSGYEHDLLHAQEQDAVEKIETAIGTTAGTGVLTNFTSGDLAARINNETLGTPAITGGTANNITLGTPLTDTIAEKTAAAGVTIDGLLIKDGGLTLVDTALNMNVKARAYASAAQNDIAQATWTKVVLGTETYDVGGDFASSTFTAPVAGYYQVCANVGFQNGTAGTRVGASIYLQGVAYATGEANIGADGYGACFVSDIIYVPVGETIDLYCLVIPNATTDLLVGSRDLTFMSVHLLSV